MPECGAGGQRRSAIQALADALVGVLVGEKEMLQNLGGIPLPRGSLLESGACRALGCAFQFPLQTFEIGIHGQGSVQ
jgi:hypothetical protein